MTKYKIENIVRSILYYLCYAFNFGEYAIVVALIFSIYCGIKGNEWAWQNKEWTDLKQFHEVQRKWAAAGVIIELVSIVIFTYAAFSIIDQINQFL